MPRFTLLVVVVLLAGCGGSGERPSPSVAVSPEGGPSPPPAPLRVVFLLNINGIQEVAIKEGRLKEIRLLKKDDNPAKITETPPHFPGTSVIFWKGAPKNHGIAPGDFHAYTSRYTVLADKSKPPRIRSDVSGPARIEPQDDRVFGGPIFSPMHIAAPGTLKDFRPLGSIRISGSFSSSTGKGGSFGMRSSTHICYEATFEPDAKEAVKEDRPADTGK